MANAPHRGVSSIVMWSSLAHALAHGSGSLGLARARTSTAAFATWTPLATTPPGQLGRPCRRPLLHASAGGFRSKVSSLLGVGDNSGDGNGIGGDDGNYGLEGLSATELKRLLEEREVDYRDCVEKKELVARLEQAMAEGRSPRSISTGTSAAAGLLPEEERTVQMFRKVSPTVVFIETSQDVRQPFSMRALELPQGTGSGFVWDDQVRSHHRPSTSSAPATPTNPSIQPTSTTHHHPPRATSSPITTSFSRWSADRALVVRLRSLSKAQRSLSMLSLWEPSPIRTWPYCA